MVAAEDFSSLEFNTSDFYPMCSISLSYDSSSALNVGYYFYTDYNLRSARL